ncbi:MAG: GIY-YIG nuclease family protein [Candidatus Doudnabacteria bacterium]|nr:GIY-YIG nuclease family protein [Candidatus Doudnabacteria bacterium]
MYYVYLIRSVAFPGRHYVGFSENYSQRLKYHNDGKSTHTNKYKPWSLICYFALNDIQQAKSFEKYLKSGSGRAFLKKHFLR